MVDLVWPNDLGAGTAVWQYFRMAADDWDADRDPQLKSAHETIVEFTPDLTQVVRYEGEMGKASIEPMVSRGIINAQGKLCTMLEDGSPGPVGVILPATDSETITPRDWTYRATITQNRVRVREFSFPAPADKEVDLADYVEVDPSGGVHIITEVETAKRAETAAGAAEKYRNETRTDRQAAQTARTGAETAETNAKTHATDAASSASSAADILTATEALGITVDNSVGTRVFVGDTMIYGDTGWREISDHLTVESENPSIYIKRENSTVWLSFNRFNPIATIGNYATILNIPQGFVPERPVRLGEGATYELGAKLYTSGSNLNIYPAVEPGSRRFYISWSASDVLPSSLPGTDAN